MIQCLVDNAPKFWDWITNRGGVALWRSANLSNPGASWCTPACTENGDPYPQPTWETDQFPVVVVTDLKNIEVYKAEEIKRFHVAVRRRGGGLTYKCTEASTKRLQKEVSKVEGAFHRFDYASQEAVIMRPIVQGTLEEWVRLNPQHAETVEENNCPAGKTKGEA